MNEQQKAEIGVRLRELRDSSTETNRSVADYVGVSERTVAAWAAGDQGMTYDNAQKVAALFSVDIDWLWRGREKGATPDLANSSQLDRIETMVKELHQEMADRKAAETIAVDQAAAKASQQKPKQRSSRSRKKSS